MNAQQSLQVTTDPLGSSGCQGDDGRVGKLLLQNTKLLVVWPEVIAPLAAAMGLINGNSVQPAGLHSMQQWHCHGREI